MEVFDGHENSNVNNILRTNYVNLKGNKASNFIWCPRIFYSHGVKLAAINKYKNQEKSVKTKCKEEGEYCHFSVVVWRQLGLPNGSKHMQEEK